ncbi:MAG: PAS domain S-box protein, partial [Deltaproteobacteria bacterium]|nr:PAS domain S-box protein [Deltaproteobacteria bacterium]
MKSKGGPIQKAKQRRAEKASSEERYRLLVENSHDVVYSVRPDGIITYISPQIRHFGYEPDELISRHFLDYVVPEQRREVIRKFQTGTTAGESLPTEFQWFGKDGQRYWVETVGKTTFDDTGTPVLQTGVMREITDRKRAEEALRRAAELLEHRIEERTADLRKQLLFEQLLTDLSARFIDLPPDDVDPEIESALKRILDLFSLDRCGFFKVLPKENAVYLVHIALKKGITPVPKEVNLALHFPWITGRILSGDVVSINTEDFPPEAAKDRASSKEIARFRYGLHIPLTLHGRVRYVIGMTVDRNENVPGDDFVPRLRLLGEIFVSALERIRAVRSLSESEAKYRIVADFTHDWEYWANADGSLRYVSPSAERISGYQAREFIEHPPLYREIIVPEDREIWDRHYRESRHHRGPNEIRFRIRRKDGEIRWIEHVCLPVTDETGAFLGFRAGNRDITERKTAEQKLKDAFSEIKRLTEHLEAESAYLQDEIRLEHNFQNIIGASDVL